MSRRGRDRVLNGLLLVVVGVPFLYELVRLAS
jgi:hypothetical protein